MRIIGEELDNTNPSRSTVVSRKRKRIVEVVKYHGLVRHVLESADTRKETWFEGRWLIICFWRSG